MNRRQEMIACLIDAGEHLGPLSASTNPTQDFAAAWSAQVAAALAAAHMDGELETWSQARFLDSGLAVVDFVRERLALLRAWQSDENLE